MFLAKAAPRKNFFPEQAYEPVRDGSSLKREIRIIAPSRTWEDLFVVHGSKHASTASHAISGRPAEEE
jgi:hypothetical protein